MMHPHSMWDEGEEVGIVQFQVQLQIVSFHSHKSYTLHKKVMN